MFVLFCLKALWCIEIRFKIGSLCSFLLCVYTTLVHPHPLHPKFLFFLSLSDSKVSVKWHNKENKHISLKMVGYKEWPKK